MKKWWIAMILAIMTTLFCVSAAAEETTFCAFEAYTVCRLNMREGPNVTFSRVKVVPEKTVVRVTGESNGWWKVEYKEHRGYIRKDLLSKGTEDSYVGEYLSSYIAYTTVRVNFRKHPGMSERILETLSEDTEVEVIGTVLDWLKVKYQGKTGYIYAKYIKEKHNGEKNCYVATTNVYMRMGAGKEYDSLTMLHDGQEVMFLRKRGNWYLVEYKGITGYVYSKYLQPK